MVKNLPASAGDMKDTGSIPASGRLLEEHMATHSQYSCPENSMDRGAWWAGYSPWGHRELDRTEVT